MSKNEAASHQVRIMTLDEVSGYLRIPPSSLYKLAREGKIPCQKVGKHWRFHREALDAWLVSGSKTKAVK